MLMAALGLVLVLMVLAPAAAQQPRATGGAGGDGFIRQFLVCGT